MHSLGHGLGMVRALVVGVRLHQRQSIARPQNVMVDQVSDHAPASKRSCSVFRKILFTCTSRHLQSFAFAGRQIAGACPLVFKGCRALEGIIHSLPLTGL